MVAVTGLQVKKMDRVLEEWSLRETQAGLRSFLGELFILVNRFWPISLVPLSHSLPWANREHLFEGDMGGVLQKPTMESRSLNIPRAAFELGLCRTPEAQVGGSQALAVSKPERRRRTGHGVGCEGCPGLQASQPPRERPAVHSRATSRKSRYPVPIVTSGAERVPSVGVKGTGLGHTLGLPTVSVTVCLAPLRGFCVS